MNWRRKNEQEDSHFGQCGGQFCPDRFGACRYGLERPLVREWLRVVYLAMDYRFGDLLLDTLGSVPDKAAEERLTGHG